MKILLILSNVFNFIKFIKHFQYTMYSDGKESASNAGDLVLIPGLGRFPGEENGNPLQCFCLENSMYRGGWWTAVHGTAKSWA